MGRHHWWVRRVSAVLGAVAVCVVVLVAQGPLTPIGQLRGRTDSTGALMMAAGVFTGTPGPLTPIAQLRGRTDSSGNLLTTVGAGTMTPDKICLDATNQDACLQRNGAGILQLGNAATSTDFARLQFGGSTASFPALKRSTTTIAVRLADDSNDANLSAASITFGSRILGFNMLMSTIGPTSPTSCGNSPVVTTTNGSTAWVVTAGGGGAATGCTIAMTAAATGWICSITNTTQVAAHRADRTTVQTASTTNSVTWEYQTVSTGAATVFTANDVFRGICIAY